MPLIDFELCPLVDITPWGRPEDPTDRHLSWFGLTYGWYSLDVKSARLFQYTPELMGHLDWPQDPRSRQADWTDYQVVRLYEDLLDMLPDILAEVPDEMHALISTAERRADWTRSLERYEEQDGDTAQIDRLFEPATRWAGLRQLDAGYLVDAPRIWLWRHRDQVHLQWDNRTRVTDNIPRWTATHGTTTMPVDDFLAEIGSFHDRLMAAMTERVHTITHRNPLRDIAIDIPRLNAEHIERQRSLTTALSTPPQPIDWAEVIAANRALRRPENGGRP